MKVLSIKLDTDLIIWTSTINFLITIPVMIGAALDNNTSWNTAIIVITSMIILPFVLSWIFGNKGGTQ